MMKAEGIVLFIVGFVIYITVGLVAESILLLPEIEFVMLYVPAASQLISRWIEMILTLWGSE